MRFSTKMITLLGKSTAKIALMVALCLGSFYTSQAQLTAAIVGADAEYGNGEEFCVDFIVDDFTDFYLVNLTISWNPDIIEFVGVEGTDAEGNLSLEAGDFILNKTDEGLLTFNWEDETEEGVTIRTRNIEENYSIFQMCFRTSDRCGGNTKIDINEASETILRAGAGSRNVGFEEDELDGDGNIISFGVNDAEINVQGTPVTITTSQEITNPDEIVCVTITAEEFTDVESMQYSLRWDTSVIQFQSIEAINTSFPFLSTSSISTRDAVEGVLTFAWFTNSGNGISVEDDTRMYNVCFLAVGEPGSNSPVEFVDDPLDVEIGTSNEGSDACKLVNDGQVLIREQKGEVTLKAGSGAVKPGQPLCIDFIADDFFAVNEMNFSLNWDPTIFRFDSIDNLRLRGLTANDFFTANAGTGFLTFTWDDDNGVLLQDSSRLFSLCFTAIGPVGSSTTLAFSSEPQPIFVSTTSNSDAGLNTRNGNMTILPPESLNLNISSATVSRNEAFCVDVTAENFEEMVSFVTSIGWETSLIDFVSVTNFGVPELDEGDFDLSGAANGFLRLNWSSSNAAGETLPDNAVLFSLCFETTVIAQSGACNAIFFSDIPEPIRAVTANSAGSSIEVTDQGNDICIFNAAGLTVDITSGLEANVGEEICVPITVRNFSDLSTVQFSINWNPSLFEFSSISNIADLPDLDLAAFSTQTANLGIIGLSWETANGSTLGSGETLFELCLTAVGSRLTCSPIEVASTPLSFEVKSPTTGDENLSLNPINSSVCIADGLEIEILSTVNPSCTDTENGSATIVVNGGDASNYNYFWTSEAGEALSFTSSVDSLSAGTYIVIVDAGSGLMITDTFTLTPRSPSPIANAGADRTLTCGERNLILQGLGSTVGRNINFDWNTLEGSGSQIAQTFLVGAGKFELIVTNDSTMCSARDTVMVMQTDLPSVDAGEDQQLTCGQESVTLDGSNSDQADNISYLWIASNGGVVGEDSTSLSITITEGGTYFLNIIHSEGCTARDTVIVTDTRINVVADAGVDKTLDCSGDPVTIGGPRSTQGENILAQWTGGSVENSDSIEVNIPGEYILTLTDQISGCSDQDTVLVVADENLPDIQVGFIDELTCTNNEVQLNIQVTNTSNNEITVEWFKDNERLPAPMDTTFAPMVSEAGFYEVFVTNIGTGCTANLAGIEVVTNVSEPTVNIGGVSVLGCQSTASAILTTEGSSMGGNFAYIWSAADTTAEIRIRTDSAEVFAAGTYYLTVTDINTGCTAIDSVMVSATEERPTANIAEANPIPCTGGTTQLDGSSSSEGTYDWVQLEGDAGVILNRNTNIATIEAPGLYRLRVTNEFGCSATDTILVTQSDTASVQFEVEYSSRDLTCTIESAEISINVSSDGDYTFNWQAQEGQNILNPNAASNEITEPGLILVEVTETNLNCTKTAIVTLNLDSEVSTLVVESNPDLLTLDCGSGNVTLDASATTPNDFETIMWRSPNGELLAEEAGNFTPQVTQAGIYTAILMNEENGCTDSLTVEVTTASDLEAVIEEAGMLTCRDSSLLLRAFNSSSGQTIEYEWSSADGNNIRPIDTGDAALIDAPGTYTLTIRDSETQCEASTSITIESDQDTPTANAGADADLGCGNDLQIGGGTTTNGEGIIYSWIRDGQPLMDNTSVLVVQSSGTYELLVTNENNGCTANDQVTITQNFQLENADAGSDEATCDIDTLMLFGNLPANATGTWTNASGANITDITNPETTVNGLTRGNNIFIWTLSTSECPSYSSDSLTIAVEVAPIANNDRAELDLDKQDSVRIKVTANDNLFNIADWTLEIDGKPELGIATVVDNNTISYTVFSLKAQTEQFTYKICSSTCPDLCSTGTITVEIEVPEDGSLLDNQPNVITPNGDGLNEQLIFDLLDISAYPDNDIIIFNRWGNIVFEASPYQNDWGGNGSNGKELPQGTYFYILRLDIAEGLILRGDVTIMK